MANWVDGFNGDDKGYATTNETVNMQYDNNSDGMGAGRTYFPKGFLLSKDDPDAPAIFFPAKPATYVYYYTSDQYSMYGSRPMLVHSIGFSQSRGEYRDPSNEKIVQMYTPGFVRCVREDY